MKWSKKVEDSTLDPEDPNPWAALYSDLSMPFNKRSKAAILNNQNSGSRRVLLPLIRPLCKLFLVLAQLIRMILRSRFSSSKILHKTIYYGLKWFVRPDANYIIIRHFRIGSAILKFIADNANINIESTTHLRPKNLEDLINDTFLIHDLNLFNFVTELNTKLKQENRKLEPVDLEAINFDAIFEDDDDIEIPKGGIFNIIDVQTAIEFYTPLYALFLSEHDFWRACNSLQLDETIAMYVSIITQNTLPLSMAINRHPMIPHSTLQADFRLMIHGLDAELLYAFLLELKHSANE